DRAGGLKDVAADAYVPSRLPEGLETGLYEVASFSPEIPNFPNGCRVCEVEIDPETGATRILRYVVIDDVGTVINSSRWRARSMAGWRRASARPSPRSMTGARASCSRA